MYFRPFLLVWSTALLLVCGLGCQKSASIAPVLPPTVLSPDTTAHVHWLGKKRLGITAGAYYFTRIWQFPQGAQLERQTLTKLATRPGQWLPGGTNLTEDAVLPLWLMLNDIVQEESYLEIRQPTNTAGEIVFAIKLNKLQREQWLTNLPHVLQPLTGDKVVVNAGAGSWSLKTTNVLNVVKLFHVGEWIVVSAGPEQNPLVDEVAARIQHDGVPFVSSGTNLWLEVGLNLPRLSAMFPTLKSQLSAFNHFDLSVSGDGANVITRGKLAFSQPFAAPLEPWRLPVELMHDPLTSFTAVRGLSASLADSQLWRNLEIGAVPDQLCFWSLAGSPYQTYLAAPLPDAHQSVTALARHLLQKGNPWLAANGYVSFDAAPDGNGVTWGNLPDIKPFIKSAGTGADGWLFAGLLPETNAVANPPPVGMINDVLRRTNLVYYDWEITGPRVQPVLALGQTARLLAHQPQFALNSVAGNWLGSVVSRLGTSATIASRTGPAELAFYRRSTLGLDALELQLFADWLESPAFPAGW